MILLIDLDNTLLNFDKAQDLAITKVLLKYGIPVTESNKELYARIDKEYWNKLEKNQITREKLFEKRFTDFFAFFNMKVNEKEVNDYYFSYLKEGGYPYPETFDFLKKCRENNNRIVIVSNGVENIQNSRIDYSGIRPYLDEIYLSEVIGYNKPDVRFFAPILQKYKDLEQMILIGDSITSDIQGGKNIGVKTIWINRNKEIKSNLPDYEVSSLMEIFNLNLF